MTYKPVAEATDPNQDAGSTTSQNKRDKNNNRGNKKGSKKEKKTKANQFNTMKHIFGNVNVYDYYSGGKHSLPWSWRRIHNYVTHHIMH